LRKDNMSENGNPHLILAKSSLELNLTLNRFGWVVNMPQMRRERLRNE